MLLVAIGAGIIYLVIPNHIRINQSLNMQVNGNGFNRAMLNENKWSEWWPQKDGIKFSNNSMSGFQFNGNSYSIVAKRLTSIVLSLKNGNDSLLTELVFIPLRDDSVALSWQAQIVTPSNPVTRLKTFFRAKSISKDLKTILQSLHRFYAMEENLYGMSIKQERVVDSILISTTAVSKSYPDVASIYVLVDKLKAHADRNGAKQTGLPMLNINTNDSITYLTRVALPVDRNLQDDGAIVFRRMLGGGNIIVTDVKGGPHSISKAFVEMENYLEDFHRASPAIPFQSLVTDRRQEPDTSKWITKIYWPVM